MRPFFLLVLCLTLALPARAQTREDAFAAMNAQDYDTSYAAFTALAATGDGEALSVLAWHYYGGRGTDKDLERAAALWRQSSEAGFARGTYNLALVLQRGQGVERDYARSLALYEQAGDEGLSAGYLQAGIAYQIGRGVGIDRGRAVAFFIKAAEADNPYAELRLADEFVLGEAVPQDLVRASRMYRNLNARRTDENLRMPSLRPRMREVSRLMDGEAWNSEHFRTLAFQTPRDGETIQQLTRRQSDLRQDRIAARTLQIEAERAAARSDASETGAMCSPHAPKAGAVVQRHSPAGYHVTRAASRGAARISYAGPIIGLTIPTLMDRDAAQALRSQSDEVLGRILLRDADGNTIGPGWPVNNERFQLSLSVKSNERLDSKCPHRAEDGMDEGQCIAEAAASFDAFAKVLDTGAEDLVMEYWVTPDRLAHSQPLQLLAPEVYAKATTLVRTDDIWGAFAILQCSADE
ncbi:MAG: tetratricopeptide repeat protein [Pseudomonadota bacterium]